MFDFAGFLCWLVIFISISALFSVTSNKIVVQVHDFCFSRWTRTLNVMLIHCFMYFSAWPLGPSQLLLRGAYLKNTRWIFGRWWQDQICWLPVLSVTQALFHSSRLFTDWQCFSVCLNNLQMWFVWFLVIIFNLTDDYYNMKLHSDNVFSCCSILLCLIIQLVPWVMY